MASKLQSQFLQSQDPEVQIVIIGKVGGGKSATGNTILGRKAFWSQIHSPSPVTQECQVEKGVVDGQNLAVVDTPGLFGGTKSLWAGSSDVKKQEKVMEQIKKCMSLVCPGPVAFLVVIHLSRFTEDEQQTIKIIQRTFGRDAAHYTMALFTRGDDLKTEEGSIDEVIGADPALRDFIRECRGGYHVFENRGADPSQVLELLQKINSMVQRNGEHSSEKAQEGEGDLQSNSFIKACLYGAFNGALVTNVISFVQWVLFKYPKPTHQLAMVGAVTGGVVGAVTGAARYAVCQLIWGDTQK